MYLDEAVLRHTLGAPKVAREQLNNLLTVQRRDNVAIRIVPIGAHPYEGFRGSFTLYELADGTLYPFVETLGFGVFVTEPSTVQPFMEVCKELEELALGTQTSDEMIKAAVEGLDDE